MSGLPSPAELTALANLREWEAALQFDFEKWGGVENPFARAPKPRRRPKWWAEATPAVRRAYLTQP